MTTLDHIQKTMLGTVVSGTLDEDKGFAMVKNDPTAAAMVDGGLIEVNGAITKGDQIAARATEAGIALWQENVRALMTSDPDGQEAPEEAPTPAPTPGDGGEVSGGYQIETGVPIPAKVRRTRQTEYPFDQLNVGDSFFVPATEERPDPTRALASTVASASKRYATQDGTRTVTRKSRKTGEQETVEIPTYHYDRRFKIARVDGGGRIWRVH